MYKSHIFHLDDASLFIVFYNGNGSYMTYAKPLVSKVSPLISDLHEVYADAAYDSFEIHSQIWYELGAHPYINWRENAVINQEGSLKRIDHWSIKDGKEEGISMQQLKTS